MYELQQEIVRLLADGPMTTGNVRNKLNAEGRDVTIDDVLSALRWLDCTTAIECLWRLNEHHISK